MPLVTVSHSSLIKFSTLATRDARLSLKHFVAGFDGVICRQGFQGQSRLPSIFSDLVSGSRYDFSMRLFNSSKAPSPSLGLWGGFSSHLWAFRRSQLDAIASSLYPDNQDDNLFNTSRCGRVDPCVGSCLADADRGPIDLALWRLSSHPWYHPRVIRSHPISLDSCQDYNFFLNTGSLISRRPCV